VVKPSHVKAWILANGTSFSGEALAYARAVGAKGLQRVYNAPAGAPSGAPQEILLRDAAGNESCVAAVAPVDGRRPVEVEVADGRLILRLPNGLDSGGVDVAFVPQPEYYATTLPSGQPITRVVSACGVSLLNIWSWHDCAVRGLCRFCGINLIQRTAGNSDLLTARAIGSGRVERLDQWYEDLRTGVKIAVEDPTYRGELFPMIISGNLPDASLDLQAELYARAAREVAPLVASRSGREGLVAMTAPPNDLSLLETQREAGIQTMAINLEAYAEDVFRVECPGKHRIGRDRYLGALRASAKVFGWGRAWSNLVFGLEPTESLLAGCRALAADGITPGASVLHFDEGATITGKVPPTYPEILDFYTELAGIYRQHDLRPYFSSRALRTSLANEAFEGRL
jgi:hypothetical protein